MRTLKNSVQLIGRLGRDPEIRELPSGRQLAKFSLATDEYYKDSEGVIQKKTQWHNIVAWGKNAETIKGLLCKGDKVAVAGPLRHNRVEQEGGGFRTYTEVELNEFELLHKIAHQEATSNT